MTSFKEKAQSTLDDIFSFVESNYDDYEVDYEDQNLKIESLEDDSVYIVSIHSPTSQIWLSSPKSGAHHFHSPLNNSKSWISTRDNNLELYDLLKKELAE